MTHKQAIYAGLAVGVFLMELAIVVAAIKWMFWVGVFLLGLVIMVDAFLVMFIGQEEGLW